MTTPPDLFDPDLLARRRARAGAGGRRLPAGRRRGRGLRKAAARLTGRFARRSSSARAAALWAGVLQAGGLPPPELRPDAPVLDLAPGAHDLVVHALALHWANDPVGQLVQCRRALRPDGLILAALFGGETLAELRAALAEAEIAETGGLSPRVAPMGEIRDLGGLLQRAGLALPVADASRFEVTYADAFALMRDLRAMGETNVLRERLSRATPRRLFARAAAIYAERFAAPGGRIRATFEVVFLTGWAPAPGQQQPLRPGSARARLADALGAPEHGAGEKAGG